MTRLFACAIMKRTGGVFMGEKLFDTVDRLNSEFVSFWLKLANIESPTDYKQGIDAAGRLFSDFAKKEKLAC